MVNHQPKIIVLLGMHKSGTSLISECLHFSRISMVEESQYNLSYDNGNKSERDATKKINNKILESENLYSLNIRNKIKLKSEIEIEMHNLISGMSDKGDWGFKDPRTCFTYPIWRNVLPPHSIIAVFRSPDEVWSHYWDNQKFKRKLIVFFNFFRSWCQHNQEIIRHINQLPNDSLVLEYSSFMKTDVEFKRLESFLKRTIVDKRDKQLYRNDASKSLFYKIAKYLHRIIGGDNPDEIVKQLKSFQ